MYKRFFMVTRGELRAGGFKADSLDNSKTSMLGAM
jgi:hypothetical protein